jgi:hypothetical protein
MPIFISYNQKDRAFVDTLARNLVAAKHNVWMDRWELSLGDSLIQKIQEALTKSSAILVILSKNSVDSEWCKKELSAGLIRESEERKTIVMPCVIDDCEIPLFIRDKLYADFRHDPDEAFRLVDQSLAKISNAYQGRSESPEFHTDHAFEWIIEDGNYILRWTFIDHGEHWPYVILSQCFVYCNREASKAFAGAQGSDAKKTEFIKGVLTHIVAGFDDKPLVETIKDSNESFVAWRVKGKGKQSFVVRYTYRRIGEDNGMDTLVYLDNNLRRALERVEEITYRPPPDAEPDEITKGIFLTGY